MAERGKEERTEQCQKLDALIKKHEELIPTVLKTLSIALPGSLGVLKKLKASLSLVLGFVPTLLNTLDMAIQELGFAGNKLKTINFHTITA